MPVKLAQHFSHCTIILVGVQITMYSVDQYYRLSKIPIYDLNHRNRSEAGRHQCSFVPSQFIHCGRFSWDFSTLDEYNDTLHEDCVELPRRSFKEADIS